MGCSNSDTSENSKSQTTPENKNSTVNANNNVSDNKNSTVNANNNVVPENKNPNDSFISDALARHNLLRKNHNADALQHNPELSQVAQKYAEYLASIDTMKHSNCDWNGQRIGENLAMMMGAPLTGDVTTNLWYDEIKDYDFTNGGFSMTTGHFTQVVWKGTTDVGFGQAQSSKGTYYAVGNYYPPGNVEGQFDANVLPKN